MPGQTQRTNHRDTAYKPTPELAQNEAHHSDLFPRLQVMETGKEGVHAETTQLT